MSKTSCKYCGSSDAVEQYTNGDYCFSCNHKSKKEKDKQSIIKNIHIDSSVNYYSQRIIDSAVDKFPDPELVWLEKYGINENLRNKYHIKYSPIIRRILLPVYHRNRLVFWQARSLDKDVPKYLSPSKNKSFFITDQEVVGKEVVIVEDIISAIKVGQIKTAVALLGTKISFSYPLSLFSKFYIWLDKDAQHDALNALRFLQGIGKEATIITTEKDPKCFSKAEIKRIIYQND